MELVPLARDPRTKHASAGHKKHSHKAEDAPMPKEQWLPSSTPAAARMRPTPTVAPEKADTTASLNGLTHTTSSTPVPLQPAPSSTTSTVPVVLNDTDYLTRPLTLEDL